MALYMRVLLEAWDERPLGEMVEFARGAGAALTVTDVRGWHEFDLCDADGTALAEVDLTLGDDCDEELEELRDFLDDHDGPEEAFARVRQHLDRTRAIVGFRILTSVHEAAVAAANVVIAYLEQRGSVLTQVDGVGWYAGDDLLLTEEEEE